MPEDIKVGVSVIGTNEPNTGLLRPQFENGVFQGVSVFFHVGV